METTKRFLVVLPSKDQKSELPCAEYGCLVDITRFEPLLNCDVVETSDGNLPRYVIDVESSHRVRIVNAQMNSAGFYDALVERVDDIEPEDTINWDPSQLITYVSAVRTFVTNLLGSLAPSARYHFEREHGKMPDDPSELSFWMAQFLPVTPYLLYEILPLKSVEERLCVINNWIEQCSAPQN